MLERIAPKTLGLWLIVAALVYLILPYDVLPDFLGFPGRVDDLLMVAWLAWLYRTRTAQTAGSNGSRHEEARRSTGSASGRPRPGPTAFDPHAVLGVERSASPDEIRAAYRARMQEYHPDKVAHLGPELQKLAHEKSQQIERAYRVLRR